MFTARLHLLPLLVALTVLVVAAPPAHAGRPQLIAMHSTSATPSVDPDGAGHLAGEVTGAPYDGTYAAQLSSYDGSLPTDGHCEPGSVQVQVIGPKGASMVLVATGSVCDRWDHHRFTGTFTVVQATKRRLVDHVGWFGMTLTDVGGGIEAYDWLG